jgi:hypothetical protein
VTERGTAAPSCPPLPDTTVPSPSEIFSATVAAVASGGPITGASPLTTSIAVCSVMGQSTCAPAPTRPPEAG